MIMNINREPWTSDRIELLKRCFGAGLTCSEIAREIGVTRNAVIGKMNRLGLSRPRDTLGLEQKRAAKAARSTSPHAKAWRPGVAAQRRMLMAAFPEPQPRDEEIPTGPGCSLLDLNAGKCRWPIGGPKVTDIWFCGNEPLPGLPYCLGHARLAYRRAGRTG
jgi:GcrA cell cycle regulator